MYPCPCYDDKGNIVADTCPFCRSSPPATDEEALNRMQKRVEVGDAQAIYSFGHYYFLGNYGLPQDIPKALELWHRAGELGFASAYNNIGYAYRNGRGVEVDKKKANHYYELAAMRGDANARHNLGYMEFKEGNLNRALKHFMVAAGVGHKESLKSIRKLHADGHASKQDYTAALRAYQAYLDEIKSDQRDKAAAARDDCKYYE